MNAREIYRDTLLAHARHSPHFGCLEPPALRVPASNPVCGDQLELFVQLVDGRIRALKFQSRSCVIATASASLLCEALSGRTVVEARQCVEQLYQSFANPRSPLPPELSSLEPLLELRGNRPRSGCVRLAWDAFLTASSSRSSLGS